MKPLPFVKMSGAGNDFVFFQEGGFSGNRSELAKRLCRRKFSIGSDGIAFFEKLDSDRVRWDFYNADGSVAEMCGNAARCAALYAVKHLSCHSELILETIAGDVNLSFRDKDLVFAGMPELKWILKNPERSVIDSGVPHVVLTYSGKSEPSIIDAKKHRFPSELDQQGANVTFVSDVISAAGSELKAITFERGVEGFTQACGTGAVAAVAYAKTFLKNLNSDQDSIAVRMPGGVLTVEFESMDQAVDKSLTRPVLGGPAEEIFRGEIFI